jgi:transcriptional regulator with GAF, ATPase, and Fis domain
LLEMASRNEFRSDLYYRLNVFPISLPPLRERREDIPALVEHFVEIFSRRMGRHIRDIPPETIAAFSSYSWPGNIRELQNLVERAVILSQDGVFRSPLFSSVVQIASSPSPGTTTEPAAPLTPGAPLTLRDSERMLVLHALQTTGWVIGGPNGAAVKLGLQRTTLIRRMKKLGIKRPLRCSPPHNDFTAPERPGPPATP